MPLTVPALLALALLGAVVVHPVPDAAASQYIPPYGILGNSYSTTLVNGIEDTEVEIPDLRTGFAVIGGGLRWVKATVVLRVQTTEASTANAYVDFLQEQGCSGTCPYIRISGSNTYLPKTGGGGSETMVITGQARIPNGGWAAIVSVKRSVGNGVIAVGQTAGTVQSIVIEDLGSF